MGGGGVGEGGGEEGDKQEDHGQEGTRGVQRVVGLGEGQVGQYRQNVEGSGQITICSLVEVSVLVDAVVEGRRAEVGVVIQVGQN